MNKENIIFCLADNDYKYKGILFAQLDNKQIEKEINTDSDCEIILDQYVTEFMAVVLTDKQDQWHLKYNIVFPSGNNEVSSNTYGKNSSETIILQDLYSMPIINKNWIKNPDGTLQSLLKIMDNLETKETEIDYE